MELPMSDREIVESFHTAKNPRGQIGVLAQLNACSEDTIRDILKRNGVDGRLLRRSGKTVTAQKTGERPHTDILSVLSDEGKRLLARQAQIRLLIPELCREQDAIESKLAALEMARNCLEAAYVGKVQEVKCDVDQQLGEGQEV